MSIYDDMWFNLIGLLLNPMRLSRHLLLSQNMAACENVVGKLTVGWNLMAEHVFGVLNKSHF